MKHFITLLLILLMGSIVTAQDTGTELIPFENTVFGIQGLVPDGWQSAGPGVYARNPSAGDVTSLIIQSAPLPRTALLGALQGQLGIDELPEPEPQVETDSLVWDVYLIDLDVQGYELTLSLAVADADGVTYVAILQTTRDESPALHESIFLPVVKSLAPIVEEEPEKSYTEEDVSFGHDDVSLAGTLSIPEGEGPFPAVILVSGSGAQDRDEGLAPIAEIKPFRDIADYLTQNGIAVLRYDDRGVGKSTGDISAATLQDFRDDASSGVDYLATRPEIDSSKIGVIGHSEGGLIAPEIALTNDNVAFIIGLGAPAVPMLDLLKEQNRLIFEGIGATQEQIDRILTDYDAAANAVLGADEDVLREAVIELMKAQYAVQQTDGQEVELTDEQIAQGLAQFSYPIMRSYFEYDNPKFWSELTIPVLAIYGSLDTQVSAEQNAPALEELTSNNPDVSVVTIEGMNHILQKAETGQVTEYADLEQSVMPEVLDTISSWILEHFAED